MITIEISPYLFYLFFSAFSSVSLSLCEVPKNEHGTLGAVSLEPIGSKSHLCSLSVLLPKI